MITLLSINSNISSKVLEQRKYLLSLISISCVVAAIFSSLSLSNLENSFFSANFGLAMGGIALSCLIDLVYLCRKKAKSTPQPLPSLPRVSSLSAPSKKLTGPISSTSAASQSSANSAPTITTQSSITAPTSSPLIKTPLMQYLEKKPGDADAEITAESFTDPNLGITFPVGYHFKSSILDTAIRNGDKEVMALYFSPTGRYYKADRKMTSIHQACSDGDHEFLERLCVAYPDKSWLTQREALSDPVIYRLYDRNDRTPLERAARAGSLRCLQILVRLGAIQVLKDSENDRDRKSLVPLFAIESRSRECFEFLLNQGILEVSEIRSLCHEAFKPGTPFELTKLLIDKEGFYVYQRDSYSWESPCAIAAFSQNKALIEYLVDQGKLNPDLKLSSGETPFFHAVRWNKDLDLVMYLLDRTSDFTHIDDKRESVFHHLAKQPHLLRVLKKLLSKIDVSTVNSHNIIGETPVHNAIRAHNFEAALAFADAGVNVNEISLSTTDELCDKYGWPYDTRSIRQTTPLQLAKRLSITYAPYASHASEYRYKQPLKDFISIFEKRIESQRQS